MIQNISPVHNIKFAILRSSAFADEQLCGGRHGLSARIAGRAPRDLDGTSPTADRHRPRPTRAHRERQRQRPRRIDNGRDSRTPTVDVDVAGRDVTTDRTGLLTTVAANAPGATPSARTPLPTLARS
jgi:hypothetical protein